VRSFLLRESKSKHVVLNEKTEFRADFLFLCGVAR
jgi:hypothetical protein